MNNSALEHLTIEYQTVMSEIQLRLAVAYELIHGDTVLGAPFLDLEAAAMNFRKIAELIVFANMAGHKDAYATLYPEFHKEWNMGKIMNKIKAINDLYYPNAVIEILDDNGKATGVEDLPEGEWLTEEELITMFGKCSDLIHARNPFADELDYDAYAALFDEWGQKINGLLSHHMVLLADKEHVIMCVMKPKEGGPPQTGIFQTDAPNGRLKRKL